MRLFIAVNLPAAERRGIWEATDSLRAAGFPLRACDAEGLHVTLKFLGSVAPDVAEALAVSLSAAVGRAKAFDLALGGFGMFESRGVPRVVWLGVERHPALELLANDVEGATSRHGFEPELKPFTPHVTIARASRDAARGAFTGLEEALAGLSYESVIPVESVDLMESTPGRNGSTYRVAHRAPLRPGG